MYAKNLPTGPWYEYVDVSTSDHAVRVRDTLQRPLSRSKVVRLVKEWSSRFVGTLELSEEPDGALHIMDGQHRWEAARQIAAKTGVPLHLPAKLWHGFEDAEKAEMFLNINVHRGPVQAREQWPLRRALEDPIVLGVDRVLAEFGCVTTTNNATKRPWNQVNCVAACERIYRVGGSDLLRHTLEVTTAAFAHTKYATDGRLLTGVAWVLYAFEDSDEYARQFSRTRLINRLSETSELALKRATSALIARGLGHESEAHAHALVDLYNFRLQNRLPAAQLHQRVLTWAK